MNQSVFQESETAGNTFSTYPSRTFNFVWDPECFENCNQISSRGLFSLISDLRSAVPPVQVLLSVPSYLRPTERPCFERYLKPPFFEISRVARSIDFDLSKNINSPAREEILGPVSKSSYLISLLGLAGELQADGIITYNETLRNARYFLREDHTMRVLSPTEFQDVVEVLAHGNSIFWSAVDSDRRITFDIFYTRTHWKNKRLVKWFDIIQRTVSDDRIVNSVKSLIFNRYPFILYSRDMVHFYDLQRDFFTRRGLMQRFSTAVGYYVSTFYYFSWGMLDHLTVLANEVLKLALNPMDCGIKRNEFLKKLANKSPSLHKFLTTEPIKPWIDILGDLRHKASHDEIPLPTMILMDTEESTKSDTDISAILRKERPLFYEIMSEENIRLMEPMMIQMWRIQKMERMFSTAVRIIRKDGTGYLYDPVISLDHELERIGAVMDGFLVSMFNDPKQ